MLSRVITEYIFVLQGKFYFSHVFILLVGSRALHCYIRLSLFDLIMM